MTWFLSKSDGEGGVVCGCDPCVSLQDVTLHVTISGTSICPGCPPGMFGISARFVEGDVNGTYACVYDETLGLWTLRGIAAATFVTYDDNTCTGEIISTQTVSFTIWVSCFGNTFQYEIKGGSEPPYGSGAPYSPDEGGFQAFLATTPIEDGGTGVNIYQCGEDSMGNINEGTVTINYTP